MSLIVLDEEIRFPPVEMADEDGLLIMRILNLEVQTEYSAKERKRKN